MKRFNNILLVFNSEVKQRAAVDRAVSRSMQNSAKLTVLTVVKKLPSNITLALSGIPSQEFVELHGLFAGRHKQCLGRCRHADAVCRTEHASGVHLGPEEGDGTVFAGKGFESFKTGLAIMQCLGAHVKLQGGFGHDRRFTPDAIFAIHPDCPGGRYLIKPKIFPVQIHHYPLSFAVARIGESTDP